MSKLTQINNLQCLLTLRDWFQQGFLQTFELENFRPLGIDYHPRPNILTVINPILFLNRKLIDTLSLGDVLNFVLLFVMMHFVVVVFVD